MSNFIIMKPLILILLALSLYTCTVSAQALNEQNTYLDASQLSAIFVKNGNNNPNANFLDAACFTILAKYGITQANINDNPFFAGTTVNLQQPLQQPQQQQAGGLTGQSDTPNPALSGNWQGIAINALATFMADRAKDEALHMAINDLFSKITGDDKVVINSLFPATYAEIEKLYDNGNGNYYSADLLYLRQLIQNDLDNLPQNVAKNPESIFPGLNAKPQLEDVITLVNTVLISAKTGRALPDIIHQLAQQNYKTPIFNQAMPVAGLVSAAMRSGDGSDEQWISPSTVSPLQLHLQDGKVRFFYGLLYQQLTDGRALVTIHTVATDLIAMKADLDKTATTMSSVVAFVNQANNAYDMAKNENFQFKTSDDAFQFVKSSSAALQQFFNSQAITTFFNIDPVVSTGIDQFLDITGLFLDKQYDRAIPVLIVDLGDYLPGGAGQKYTRQIAFISQLVSVQNEKDFESLLNSYALPIGSSSIKRNSSVNVSINGYVGFTGGFETAYGTKANQTKGNMGLTAPIGISVTLGGGFTTFVSVIDLGSIVNARLNNDTSNYSGLKLEQFFSPGLGLYYNFKHLPLTLGAHYSYIPDLRTITYSSGNAMVTDTHASVSRINLSVLIDIPLFTLFNKTPK
jgi:hypothetical protein